MTTRLYYTDAYRTQFVARVMERLTWEGRPAVVLDQTLFYPTSGGQPADRGVLNETPVLDVVVRESDGAIIHITADEPEQELLEGTIDWPRRFDHMQQHTGQHILSAAFERLLDADTVGFHLGTQIARWTSPAPGWSRKPPERSRNWPIRSSGKTEPSSPACHL
jgi:Predicted metal-dependent hydrolases related to alanyl-tRNA synthetase HxxxH domain